ncbi:MAG: FtsX-like permease family protein [Atopobiaceae bacterium]|nr:FtsX-like permease family protein [Atopobiaceae bacterium]
MQDKAGKKTSSRSSFFKELGRSISSSWGRFLAIMGIAALGCGFYAGLQMTGMDMRLSADSLYDQTQLYDIRLLSTLGLSDEQVDELRHRDGIEAAMGTYSIDVMANLNDEQYAMRIESLSPELKDQSDGFELVRASALDLHNGEYAQGEQTEAAATNDGIQTQTAATKQAQALNYLVLTQGRFPQTPNECVMSGDRIMGHPIQLGDKVQVLSGVGDIDEQLQERDFEVVGLVSSSVYVSSTNLGPTSIGSGKIEQFMYVVPESFDEDFPISQVYMSVKGARAELAESDSYDDVVARVVQELEADSSRIADDRLAKLKEEAQDTLEEKRQEFDTERDDAYKKLDEAKQELTDAEKELADAEQELADGQQSYDDGVREFEDGKAEFDEQRGVWEQTRSGLTSQRQALVAQQTELEQTRSQLIAAQSQLQAQQAQAAQSQAALAQASQLATQAQQLAAQLAQVEAGLQQVAAGIAQIDAGISEGDTQIVQAQVKIAESQEQLESARLELEQGKRDYEKGLKEYNEGLETYEKERVEAEEKIADAQKKLDDAQTDIDELEAPEIYVLDRTRNPGAESYQQDSERIDNIAQVFPLIFFLVAALVALTTMTRMVEDERQEIGTYKALGYGTARITAKYLAYAALAGGIGAFIGIAILSQILPYIISVAYDIMYSVPIMAFPLPINIPIALTAAALGVGVMLVATWAAAASTLRESPAQLMLPRAPKAGKRILLEHIGPLWRRTSFSWKVSLRNLFRYKRRLAMTIIGIAGCTALLLTGLGLHDSIWDIIDKQFGEIVHYDAVISLDDDADEDVHLRVEEMIAEASESDAMIRTMMLNRQLGSDSHAPISSQVVVPQSNDDMKSLIHLRQRHGAIPIELDASGVVLSEKLSSLLGVSAGDSVRIYEQDDIGNAVGSGKEVRVAAVCENYVYNYCYIDQDLYRELYAGEPIFSTILAKIDTGEEVRSQLAQKLHDVDEIDTVSYNDEVIDSYRKSLRSVNMIVVVLVVAAAALAFIVLYNLTNINIVERTREIASLKVLGFTPHEVNAYVNRETLLLTGIGAAFGLILGTIMEEFVVISSEVDLVMFGREIHPPSFIIAFVVTLGFSLVVMLFMRRKLSSIDMVESLKSVD